MKPPIILNTYPAHDGTYKSEDIKHILIDVDDATSGIEPNEKSFSMSSISYNPSNTISKNMNINQWYNNPIYDFNMFGSGIMENIDAQQNLSENALDVFSVEIN